MQNDSGKPAIAVMWRILLLCVAVGAALWMLWQYDLRHQVSMLFRWLEDLGAWGPLFFILIYTLVVICVLPGVLFTVGAGFLFGMFPGFVYVVISTTLGATAAFFLGRTVLGERAKNFLYRRERIRVVTEHLIGKGWRVIMLTRLTPLFPFKLSNYIFGLAHFRFKDFLIGTFFGIMPLTFVNAYIGAMAADLATLRQEAIQQSPLRWAAYGAGLVVMILLVSYIARTAWQALNAYREEEAE